jgi:hypothetical protein
VKSKEIHSQSRGVLGKGGAQKESYSVSPCGRGEDWLHNMWVMDSGCTWPMGNPDTIGVGVMPGSERGANVKVLTSNKEGSLVANKACDVRLSSNVAGCKESLVLEGVLVSKKFSRNLLSVSRLCEPSTGLSTVLDSEGARVVKGLKWTGEVILESVCVNGLYLIPSSASDLKRLQNFRKEQSLISFTGDGGVVVGKEECQLAKFYTGDLTFREVLHNRTGHVYAEHIDKVFGHLYGKRDLLSKHRLCHTCGIMCMQRHTMKPKRTVVRRAVYDQTNPKRRKEVLVGAELHHDWQTRSKKGKSRRGFRGVDFVVDKATGRIFLVFCQSESEMQEGLVILKRRLETQLGRKVRIIHGDSSAANRGHVIEDECIDSGTETTFSTPYVKELNGYCEAKVKLWKKVVRCIDYHAGGLPDSLWDHTDAHAALIVNLVPLLQADKKFASPMDHWEGEVRPERLNFLRTYGCLAIAYVHKERRDGSVRRGVRCAYLGMCPKTRAYKLLVLSTGKIITSVHVTFDETELPFRLEGWIPKPLRAHYLVSSDDDDEDNEEVVDVTTQYERTTHEDDGEVVDVGTQQHQEAPKPPSGWLRGVGSLTVPPPGMADEGVRSGSGVGDVSEEEESSDEKEYGGGTSKVSGDDRSTRLELGSDFVKSESGRSEASETEQELPSLEDPGRESVAKEEEANEEQVVRESPREAVSPRRSSRHSKQVDHGPVVSHFLDGEREVFQVPVCDTGRSEASHEAAVAHYLTSDYASGVEIETRKERRTESSHLGKGLQGEDISAFTESDGIEQAHFTVPIEVKLDVAYYKGVKVNDISIPRNFNHVKSELFRAEWEGAMDDEYDPLVEKGTWVPVYKKEGEKVMGCLWVYSLKVDLKKKEMRFKARLCAQGSGRMMGIDHTEWEIYANVLKLKTLRINLALAIQDPDARVGHWDIKNAFVATDMPRHKVVLMRQPQGYYVHGGQVLQLMKALYGLPESMRLFTDNLKQHLLDFGFVRCKSDPSMYLFFRGKEYIRIPVWVDDLFPTYNSERLRDEVFAFIKGLTIEKFELIDLGELSDALGVQFNCDWEGGKIEMSMDKQKRKLLASTGMEDCNPAHIPMVRVLEKPEGPVTLEETERVKGVLGDIDFRSVVGSAGYMVQAVCAPMSHAHSTLSRFNNGVTFEAAKALKHLLRYIKGTLGEAMVYTRKSVGPDLRLVSFAGHNFPKTGDQKVDTVVYTDASFADDRFDSKSQTGMCVFLFGCLVVWKSVRQSTVATSTYHAETIAAHEGATEIVWIRLLLQEVRFAQEKPSVMWQDNAAVIRNTYNPTKHEASKHIRVKYMWKRELLDQGVLVMLKIPTTRQVSDVLTKPLMRESFQKYSRVLMGLDTWPEVFGESERSLYARCAAEVVKCYWPR